MIVTLACSDYACRKTRRVILTTELGVLARCSCGEIMGLVLFSADEPRVEYEPGALTRTASTGGGS